MLQTFLLFAYFKIKKSFMFKGEVKVYVSAKGNDQYILSPLKIPRGPLCSKINDDYRKFLMKELGTTSDLPSSDDEDICPLFVKVNPTANKYEQKIDFVFLCLQKTYNVKDYLFATDNIPKFLQPGWYKVHIMISDKSGTLVSGLELTCHLY